MLACECHPLAHLYTPFTHGPRMTAYSAGMKTILTLICSVALLINARSTRACGAGPRTYATMVLSQDDRVASNAVVMLRSFGRQGLEALLETHQQLIETHRGDDPQWKRLRFALDAVGGQRDCFASRLFWHTNFADAKAEAQRTGKPILSLRLLGHLDEELSCANSRFFRTTLYSNKDVSAYLRDHFVLHWKSVRPVPRITIDMGDGRKIERTITGNSIHYVLDANGDVVDALPGLYGPRAFLAGLRNAEIVAHRTANLEPSARARELESYHTAQLSEVNRRWANDLAAVSAPGAPVSAPTRSSRIVPRSAPGSSASPSSQVATAAAVVTLSTAAAAMPLTATKRVAEMPMLRSLTPRRAELERSTDDALWARIAALHKEDGMLDAHSVELIRAKTMNAPDAMRLALSKSRVEDPMLKTIQNLQRSIAEDTVRNEYTFHARIHEWLGTASAPREVDSLNRRVYAELFLTPDSDPWLGLVPADTFSAVENGGLVSNSKIQIPNPK